MNEVSCVLNDEAPFTSFHFREFVLKNSVVVMDFRRMGVAIALSHLVRSFLSTDTRTELLIEISQFRAEISKAEATLQQTSLVLGHCNSYSNFLVYIRCETPSIFGNLSSALDFLSLGGTTQCETTPCYP